MLSRVQDEQVNTGEYFPILGELGGTFPAKFEGPKEICCGGHLAVTYGSELLFLWIS